jgi:acyl carrier protein
MATGSEQPVRNALIKAIANVEGVDDREIEDAIGDQGSDQMYELDSKTAEAVLAEVGDALGFVPVGPADLAPEQYSTLEALVSLVEAALAATGRSR